MRTYQYSPLWLTNFFDGLFDLLDTPRQAVSDGGVQNV